MKSSPGRCRGLRSRCPGGRATSNSTAATAPPCLTVPAAPKPSAEVERLRALLLELSATVSTHPYRAGVKKEKEKVVEARMALKHARETEDNTIAA
ncbi:hypothetical protein ACWDZ4_30350 [Streptomyces sp. NPDC003016]